MSLRKNSPQLGLTFRNPENGKAREVYYTLFDNSFADRWIHKVSETVERNRDRGANVTHYGSLFDCKSSDHLGQLKLLAGEKVAFKSTKPYGCSVKY